MIRPPWFPILSLGVPALVMAAEPVLTPRIELLATSASFAIYPDQLVTGDMDGDGDLDLINLPNGGTTLGIGDPHGLWIENRGGREFAPLRLAQVAPTGFREYLYYVKPINLTGDAKLEFFASRNSSDLSEYVPLAMTPLLGPGGPAPVTGTPLAEATEEPWHALDLDGDGQGELLRMKVLNNTDLEIRISDRQADGSFAESVVFTVAGLNEQEALISPEAVDMDGDGLRELVLTLNARTAIFARTGARTFNAVPVMVEDVNTVRSWMDLNGDGRPDAPGLGGEWVENLGGLSFLRRVSSLSFPPEENVIFEALEARAGQPALAHFVVSSLQGVDEVVTVPFNASAPVTRRALPVTEAAAPVFLHLADLDGDGQVDLVYSYSTVNLGYYDSRILAVAWGSAAGFSEPQALYVGPAAFHEVLAADVNRDKCVDLLRGPDANGRYWLRFNRGKAGLDADSRLGEELPLDGLQVPGASLRILGVLRIDKNATLDLVCNYTRVPQGEAGPEQAIVVVRGRRDGSFIKPVIPAGGLNFAAGPVMDGDFIDWDRDGDPDLVADGYWQENVKGAFPPGRRFLVELGTMEDFLGNPTVVGGTITGDLDGDKRPDIISLIHGAGQGDAPPATMRIAYGDGRGGISATADVPLRLAAYDSLGNPTVAGGVVITDLNADKLPDLWLSELTGYDLQGNPAIEDRWLRNPGKRSRNPESWVSQPLEGNVPAGVALADFNGDRKLEWVGPYGYLQPGKQGPVLSQEYDFSGGVDLTREPYRAAADVDADGDADFILGGSASTLVVLFNTEADDLKKRALKAKEPKWVRKGLDVVR
ncbi:FG-GAP repeat domain-containing protein [Luteolibacter sp. Populi]|uniref:FG-GAP repeat domain-containing protein n=1 Tax=Luteolibacter sp. Populi TaxID=3230487 RepID=UPI0034655E10